MLHQLIGLVDLFNLTGCVPPQVFTDGRNKREVTRVGAGLGAVVLQATREYIVRLGPTNEILIFVGKIPVMSSGVDQLASGDDVPRRAFGDTNSLKITEGASSLIQIPVSPF